MDSGVRGFLDQNGWETVATLSTEGRPVRLAKLDADVVSVHTARFADRMYPDGLFRHQAEAVELFAQGENVCLTTGTASGKTTLFHCAAVEEFSRHTGGKVVCLYPLKALASEQEERWQEALGLAIKGCHVGRIAGDVPVKARAGILRQSHVVVMTPDVMHAWMLPSVGEKDVKAFLRNLRLVIVDEAHAYSGVFGSNAAFLFRRLRHLCSLLNEEPRFVAASATIAEPREHLRRLVGVDFALVGEESNGARKHPSEIHLLNPPPAEDLLTALPKLFQEIAAQEDRRLIAFVDSRKQVELLTSIAIRGQHDEDGSPEPIDKEEDDLGYQQLEDSLDFLQRLSILPYRSGYEEADRRLIQKRLRSGALKGVISTSALELGIDIPALDTAVLVGVPATSTSLHQRLGRVGRHKPGEVYVVNTGSIYDDAVFSNPEALLTRPPAESALYLENERIQYIHALCLARLGGEHDLARSGATEDYGFTSSVDFPHGFARLCEMERTGQVPVELQGMKNEGGESPNHAFPLRDVEASFKLTFKNGPEEYSLGSLSYSQCLREAYPGAVYRYATRSFRVYQVNTRSKEIRLRKEKGYVTKPSTLPTLVFPNLSHGNLFKVLRSGDLAVLECNLQVREWLNGFSERRGQTEFTVGYPHINGRAAFSYPHPTFYRNYFTSGLVLFHPVLSTEGVDADLLARLLFEAFLLVVPFERTDVSAAKDKLRTQWKDTPKDSRFLSVYDSTYGSLHLSGRLLDVEVLRESLANLADLAVQQEVEGPTLLAALKLSEYATCDFASDTVDGEYVPGGSSDSKVSVIVPGSTGLLVTQNNEPIHILRVYWNAKEGALFYKGRLESMLSPDDSVLAPVERVAPIVGESVMGTYDVETGELEVAS